MAFSPELPFRHCINRSSRLLALPGPKDPTKELINWPIKASRPQLLLSESNQPLNAGINRFSHQKFSARKHKKSTHATPGFFTREEEMRMPDHSQFNTDRTYPGGWTITFSNPPINMFVPTTIVELGALMTHLEADPSVKVVVFQSANPDFFIAHLDVAKAAERPETLGLWREFVLRLSSSPVVSIAKIRGRTRGIGNEFVLACDMRFASRQSAIFGNPEVGVGLVPGGGAMEWLPRLVGRSRALEIVLSGNDFDADIAERYGWVNRTLDDNDLDSFVDTLVRRLASFDREALAAAKAQINRFGTPTATELQSSNDLFFPTLAWPTAQARRAKLRGIGYGIRSDFELNFGRYLPSFGRADADDTKQKNRTNQKEYTMTQTSATPQGSKQDKNAIRPFQANVPEAELSELRRRINATKWPERETVADASQGVQLATTQALARYWGSDYDWRKCETKLNALPQFITEIDGLDIHFIHVRSKHENALPLIVTHGWPGSVVEQLKIIDPLTNPTAHGGSASDAFHLVIPSMPGYGYSGKPATTGWGPDRIARAWVMLMKRLGYTKFVAQGGDWGAVVTELMGVQAPPELLGIHVNMPGIFPVDIDKAALSGVPAPSGLSADEKVAYERVQFVYQKGIAYGYQMGLRPQTLYGIADSPVGLAAYFLDHDARSYELITRVFNGVTEGLTRDDILDNITLTWLTNTAISGARLYWENKFSFFSVKGVSIPVAVSVFPDELYSAPRSWTEQAFPNLIHYNKLNKGGHFAAWEQPKLLSEEVRVGFRSLRSSIVKSAA
jgi:enoyl-CoA hydratase/carnithine racemase/pimeloyl-ACP methyl ester carboxylesterase